MTQEKQLKKLATILVPLLLSLTGLQGCVEDDSESAGYVLQECDAIASSVDPDSGLVFYECSSPWRSVPNQPVFAWYWDCETAMEIEQESDPQIVRSQPDIDGRFILMQCERIIY